MFLIDFSVYRLLGLPAFEDTLSVHERTIRLFTNVRTFVKTLLEILHPVEALNRIRIARMRHALLFERETEGDGKATDIAAPVKVPE